MQQGKDIQNLQHTAEPNEAQRSFLQRYFSRLDFSKGKVSPKLYKALQLDTSKLEQTGAIQ